jgi:hypothetical protein
MPQIKATKVINVPVFSPRKAERDIFASENIGDSRNWT